jgi:ferredoxin
VTAKVHATPQVLFGIRPCDLNGIKIMNEAFAEGHGDPNYLAKMEKSIIIGMECSKVCDKHAFCYKVESHNAPEIFDVMLYGCGCGCDCKGKDGFTAKAITTKGKHFIEKYFSTTEGKQSKIDEFLREKQEEFGKQKPFKDLKQFPELFEKNNKHPVWEHEGKRCLSCGSCIMVCPTCYCFDAVDNTELNLKKGARQRKWDACMLSSFATVTGGENFRHSATARLHHRINRKFNYLMSKHGQSVCVGCGRCVRACLVEISPKTIAEAINGEKNIK